MLTKRAMLILAAFILVTLASACTGVTTTATTAATTAPATTITTQPGQTTTEGTTTVTTTQTASYLVTFEVNGGSSVSPQTIVAGSHVAAVDIERVDYALDGWYADAALTDPWDFAVDVVTANLTLYAKWTFAYAPEGAGTEADPYLIATTKDLDILRDGRFATDGKWFVLTADLEVIGDFTAIDGIAFGGTLDGDGHVVVIVGDAGLFFENAGTIRDLHVTADIETASTSGIGAVAHLNSGLIADVVVDGAGIRSLVGTVGVLDLEGLAGGAGAIVGVNGVAGVITGAESHTNVQARVGGGGIAGFNLGVIRGSSHWGTVGESEVIYISAAEASVGKFSYAGGIAGVNLGAIEQCQNRGRVFAQRAGNSLEDPANGNRVFGGIAGYNGPDGIVTECYNAYGTAGATVHADRIVGGIVGQNLGVVTYSYSPANIGARANLGGIVGLLDETEGTKAYVAYCWTNSNFRSDGNEADEISAYDVANVSNWYNLAKFAEYSYYNSSRGLAPEGEGNLAGSSVTLDMTALLNTGLEAGAEIWVVTGGSSSGNAKTKLAWQKNVATFIVEGVPTEVVVQMGDTPSFAAPEKTGYAFAGWRTDPVDPATAWTPAGITADITVTAVFTPVEYTIAYVLDGGTNDAANPGSYTIESAALTLLPATRPGCAFLGWFDGADAQVTAIAAGSYGDLTLTAKWEITVAYLTVSFTSTELPDQTLLDLEGSSIELASLEQAGYEFLGWSLDGTTVAFEGGTVLVYADLSAAAVDGAVALTPLFQEILTYIVSFDANGATGTMADLTYVVGTTYDLPANAFTATGFTFYGWTYGGTLYEDGAAVTDLIASGLTAQLVALWLDETNLVPNGDFAVGGTMTSTDLKSYVSDVWTVYRSGATKVSSLAGAIADGVLTIDATTTTGATSTNFYLVVQITLPTFAVGSQFVVTFDAKISDAAYTYIAAYLRTRPSGSTTYSTISNLAEFTTLGTTTTTFTAVLTSTAATVEGNTYYLILPLAPASGAIAGTFTWTIDNVVLEKIGPAA